MLHRTWHQRPTAKQILEQIVDWPRVENGFETVKKTFAFIPDFKGVNLNASNNTCHNNTFGSMTQ